MESYIDIALYKITKFEHVLRVMLYMEAKKSGNNMDICTIDQTISVNPGMSDPFRVYIVRSDKIVTAGTGYIINNVIHIFNSFQANDFLFVDTTLII